MGISIISIISAILFFVLFAATNKTKLKTILGVGCGFIFAVSILFSIVNEKYHIGMHEVSKSQKIEIISLTPNMPTIMKQTIDKSGNELVVYKTEGDDKPKQTPLEENVSVKVEQNVNNKGSYLEIKKQILKYNNPFVKMMFNYPDRKLEPTEIKYIFHLSPDFKILDKKQLEQIK